MAKNRTYTGGKKSVGTPTLSKSDYYQLIRKIRIAALRQQDGKTDLQKGERT